MEDGMPLALPAGMSFGATFFWATLFGLVGTFYFLYGKKNEKYPFIFAGIVMGVYPLFATKTWSVILVGLALMAAPFLLGGE